MRKRQDLGQILGPEEPVITLEEAARSSGIPLTKLINQVRDGALIGFRQQHNWVIPQRYLDSDGGLNRFILGFTALLTDGGYEPHEILNYLFTPDDTLPGRPIDCLHGHLAREVMRRAQAMAL